MCVYIYIYIYISGKAPCSCWMVVLVVMSCQRVSVAAVPYENNTIDALHYKSTTDIVSLQTFGRHYLSNATCLMRPHLFGVFLRVKDHHLVRHV